MILPLFAHQPIFTRVSTNRRDLILIITQCSHVKMDQLLSNTFLIQTFSKFPQKFVKILLLKLVCFAHLRMEWIKYCNSCPTWFLIVKKWFLNQSLNYKPIFQDHKIWVFSLTEIKGAIKMYSEFQSDLILVSIEKWDPFQWWPS